LNDRAETLIGKAASIAAHSQNRSNVPQDSELSQQMMYMYLSD